MSCPSEVANLYRAVIEDVIGSIRDDFINMGVDEQVLLDLQENWERKLIDTKVLNYNRYKDLFISTRSLSASQTDPGEDAQRTPLHEDRIHSQTQTLYEESLGSDLDDTDEGEVLKTANVLICQYEKVTRVKNKWKAQLKTASTCIEGVDFLFGKLNAEFEWK
ncbi:MAG: transcription initiation factor IIA subunit 1 [Amphiamblys sp. WSBS2006]|nr:MAG: transcription initiation factor IIA subunit 1 [Amphiamblys sp. WSBS2006]